MAARLLEICLLLFRRLSITHTNTESGPSNRHPCFTNTLAPASAKKKQKTPVRAPATAPTTSPQPLTMRKIPSATSKSSPSPIPLPEPIIRNPTPIPTPIQIPSPIPTPIPTPAPLPAPIVKPLTPLPSLIKTPSPIPTPTKSFTPIPTPIKSPTPIPTPIKSPTPIPTPIKSPTPIPTPVKSPTPIPTPIKYPTPIPTPIKSPTPIPTPVKSPTPIPTPIKSPTPIPTPIKSPTPIPTPIKSPTPVPTPKKSPTPIPSPIRIPSIVIASPVGSRPPEPKPIKSPPFPPNADAIVIEPPVTVKRVEPKNRVGCSKVADRGLDRWKESFFSYKIGEDGRKQRVIKLFHKSVKPQKKIKISQIKNLKRSWNSSRHGNCEKIPWSCLIWTEYTLVIALALVMMAASFLVCLFWIYYFRGGIATKDTNDKLFNIHPIAMLGGFVCIGGIGIIQFRVLSPCRRQFVKLTHALLMVLIVPCTVVGVMAVSEYHKLNKPPILDFCTLHSWMGVLVLALFAFQMAFGVVTYLILNLVSKSEATQRFRLRMLPLHAGTGVGLYVLAVATCVTGLSSRAFSTFGSYYEMGSDEGKTVNLLGVLLVLQCLCVSYLVARQKFRVCPSSEDRIADPEAARRAIYRELRKKAVGKDCPSGFIPY